MWIQVAKKENSLDKVKCHKVNCLFDGGIVLGKVKCHVKMK